MPKLRKCTACGQLIQPNEETILYKKRIIHKACYDRIVGQVSDDTDIRIKTKALTRKQEHQAFVPIKDSIVNTQRVSDQEALDKQAFIDYYKSIFGDNHVIKTVAMAGYYMREYGLTWEGMRNTMQDHFELHHGSIDIDNPSIGFIPYEYEDSQKLRKEIAKMEEYNTPERCQAAYASVQQIEADSYNRRCVEHADHPNNWRTPTYKQYMRERLAEQVDKDNNGEDDVKEAND